MGTGDRALVLWWRILKREVVGSGFDYFTWQLGNRTGRVGFGFLAGSVCEVQDFRLVGWSWVEMIC